MTRSKSHKLNTSFWLYMVMTLLREVIENCLGSPLWASMFSYFLFLYALMSIFIFTTGAQKRKTALVLIVICMFFGLNFLLFPTVRQYIVESAVNIVTGTLPLLLYLANVTDFKDFTKSMERWAFPYVALGGVYVILKYIGVVSEEIDYMQVAYYVLIPVCVLGYLGIHHKNVIYKLTFFAFILAIFLLGSRGGALVGIMVYAALYLSYMGRGKRRFVLIIAAVATVLIASNFETFLGSVDNLLVSYGYEGRITSKLESGSLFESEGRELRQTIIIAAMVQNGYAPFGIFGDRELTKPVTETGEASYAHNFILEFLVDFGLYGGIIALVLLAWWIVRCYRRSDEYARGVILLFAIYSLVKLSLSMSYLIEDTFYCLMGILISCTLVFKKKNNYAVKNTYYNL